MTSSHKVFRKRLIECIKIDAYYGFVEFEYDSSKSHSSARKHEIDFLAAQSLWDDGGLVILPWRFAEETRFLAIGKVEAKVLYERNQ